MPEAQPSAAALRSRDPRRWIYVAFDLLSVVGYLIAFKLFLQNRHDWATAVLYIVPAAAVLMAIGTALARPWSWWLVVVGAATMLLWTAAILILLLYTASYLSGVYGAFGKAAASGVIGAAAFVVQFVAMLPAFQLKWAMTRAGRRAFGLEPLWPAPPRAIARKVAA
jgi:cation transport ATPase